MNKTTPKHKTAVEGYEDLLKLLCKRIHRMRYDKVEEFYRHSSAELRRQAKNDRVKGRIQLAALLEETANADEQQQKRFARIWDLCKPHMKNDSFPKPQIRRQTMSRSKGINTFSLLAAAFQHKREEMCLDLVEAIYYLLMHQAPPASLKRKWAKEVKARCSDPLITGGDFEVKTLTRRGNPTGMYYISVRSCINPHGRTSTEAYLNYSNTALCMGIYGRKDWIARRALQMASTCGSTVPPNHKTMR